MPIGELNIQAIAKWFELGCQPSHGQPTEGVASSSSNEPATKGFHILECNDICLLSKLADVKNKTLLERAHKQLTNIKEPVAKKNFLLAICSEFLRDGRKTISLKLVSDEIDNETELFHLFRPDLQFHRTLCHFKLDRPIEALCDLYEALESTEITSLDRIHVQILEEIKKFLTNNKIKERQHVKTKQGTVVVTVENILQQYEAEICAYIKRQMDKERVTRNTSLESGDTVALESSTGQLELSDSSTINVEPQVKLGEAVSAQSPSYRNRLIDGGGRIHHSCRSSAFPFIKRRESKNEFNLRLTTHQANMSGDELNITYTVAEKSQQICVRSMPHDPIIDNIFSLNALLVDNLHEDYDHEALCEIFGSFGSIVNIRCKENSEQLIIEYNNADSPRMAISYLSRLPLPQVSRPNHCLQFRFYKSENQRNLRICKQNQAKSSNECYFWRTTGCQNVNCKFYHNRLAKGVDYQEWMRTEPRQV